MLRGKHISNLSNGARSFFLSGSRGSAADGSSCTCSEDETCIPRRQQIINENLHTKRPSTPFLRTSERVGTIISGDAVEGFSSQSPCVDQIASPKQVASTPRPLGRSDDVSYAICTEAAQKDVEHSQILNADNFVRAGVATVNFLSDLANYKLLLSNENEVLNSSKKSMVDARAGRSSIKTSNVKHIKRESFYSVHPKPSAEVAVGSKPKSSCHGTKDKGDSSTSAKDFKHVPSRETRSSGTFSEKIVPQRQKAYLNSFRTDLNSNIKASNVEIVGYTSAGLNKPSRDMKSPIGYVPIRRPAANTGNIVERFSRILQGVKWGIGAEEALRSLNCPVDAYQANQILKQLNDSSVALGFFYWLKRQAGFKHDGHTYTTMVGVLGRARQFGAINKLLIQMVEEGCVPNVVTYNRLIHSYGRANYLHEAMDVFNQMQKAGCEPDRVTYSTLIDIHAKAGFLDIALSLYDRMQEAGLSPDTFTYSVMINCLGKAGHLASAHKLFCRMVDQGCIPNLVTYNIMIDLQAKARNYETALKLYRDMQNAGFQPDKVTYSIVMEVLGHCGCIEEAEAIFIEMKRKNWVPDEPVYGLLIDLWGKVGNVEKAWGWYQAMISAGLRPNVPTFNSLLSAYLRVNRLSDAFNMLQSIVCLDLKPSLQTYTLLLSYCTEVQSSYEMGFCSKLMSITGHPAHTFLLSMPSAGPNGQNVRDHVSMFLDLIHSEDRESKRGLVDAVVDFLHKSGLKEEAGSVWEVAAEKNVYPDAIKEKSSCYWLINLHVMSDGTAITALSRTLSWFRQKMLVSGICPSRIDIVTGWGRRSRVTGSSLVRQSIQELLHIFSFPFFVESGNSGCFIGCGEPLNRWLLQSCVDRMHLL